MTEAVDSGWAGRRRVLTVLGIFVLALAVRLPGIAYGLPAAFAPDELAKVQAVADLDDPEVEPPTQQPAFLINTMWVVLKIAAPLREPVVDWLGLDASVPGVGAEKAFDILVGRVWMAVLSSFTAVCVFFLGLRLHSLRAGELAGLMYCFFRLAISTAHYVKEDTPVTLFVTLAMLGAVSIVRGGSWKAYALTALACGAATGAKYIGGLSVGMLLLAHFLGPGRHRLLLVVPLGLGVGLLASSPQSARDLATAWFEVGKQTEYLSKGHHDGIAVSAWEHWFTFYLRRALIPGLGVIPLAAAAVGAFFLVWNRHRAGLVLVAGIVVYYLGGEWMSAKPYPFFARYMLPIAPLLAVAAAVGVLELGWRLGAAGPWRRRVPAGLYMCALIPIAVRTLAFDARVTPDTRTRATAWMADHLPPGAEVALPPGFAANTYVPLLPPSMQRYDRMDPGQLEAKKGRPEGVYVLLSGPAIDRYIENPRVKPELVEFIGAVRAQGVRVAVFESRAGRLGFHNPTIELFHLSESAATIAPPR